MASKILSKLGAAGLVGTLLLVPACGGGSSSSTGNQGNNGNFLLLSSNMGDGVTWELNKLIQLTFNNPVDMDTVHFGTVLFSSAEVTQPVTGSFEPDLEDPHTIYFRPTCPTANDYSNGGFLPGGHTYTMTIPTSTAFGAEVLRDRKGRALAQGITRSFSTPTGAGSSLFLDYVSGPPKLLTTTAIEWPQGLNFYNDPDPSIRFNFNQAIDARDLNLNLRNLYILYADGEIGSANEDVFPEDNKLPGTIRIEENCVTAGAVVLFEIAGMLPPNRKLQAVIKRDFADIAGQTNFADIMPETYSTPTLAEALGDSSTDWSTTEVADEYQEFFENSTRIDLDSALPLPNADFDDGFVQASFDFPGTFTTKDFYLDTDSEISTLSQSFFTDSNNTTHTILNGVINCRNFTLDANAEIRGTGPNPLVIYATGTVLINGKIDVSGFNAVWPTGLNSPQRPEGGAFGVCGGGDGGTSSQEVFQETFRASSGEGAWGFAGNGGQGGEGGFNQEAGNDGSYNKECVSNTAAGGGGGTFALTDNVSIYWTRWKEKDRMPSVDRNFSMDHRLNWNTATDPQLSGDRFVYTVAGGEAGIRGSSWGSTEPEDKIIGVYGMEDESPDFIYDPLTGDAQDGWKHNSGGTFNERFSTPWTDPVNDPNPFSNEPGETTAVDTVNEHPRMLGHPTRGADGGLGGPSIFSNDGTTANDFWGARVNNDGSVTPGELLVPWAGSGGGASGDMVIYRRGGANRDEPLEDSFPDPNFPNGAIDVYRKGAPGGGGGGQVLIMSIGDIVFGSSGKVHARGGNGMGGESIGWTYGQVSGSGGGSGGHIVLSTASKLDLSAVDITDGSQGGDQTWTIEDKDYYSIPISGVYFTEVLNAVGGRRGWAMSRVNQADLGTGMADDGNETYAVGRGGAGGNGVIQIHVPEPTTDIIWPTTKSTEIKNYLHDGDIVNNDLDRDRLEEILRIFAAPRPYALVPFFSARSMFRSQWIDTGLAELRQPATGKGVDYPDYASSVLSMAGFDTADGTVETSGGMVSALTAITSGSNSSLTLFEFEARVSNASTIFSGIDQFLLQPNLLRGYGFQANTLLTSTRTIVSAAYNSSTDTLTLLTDPADGSLLVGAGANWAIQPRFFRLATSGLSDALPDTSEVRIQFQGAEESTTDDNEPGPPFPDTNTWTSDLSQLEGYRFIRYQVLFNIDAQSEGVDLSTPRPLLSYIKVPYTF